MKRIEQFYVILMVVSFGSLIYFAVQSVQSLQSDLGIDAIHQIYHRNAELLTYGVPGLALLFLAGAAVLDWKLNKSRYFVMAGLFYIVLTAVDYMVVCESYFVWIRGTGQWKGSFSASWIVGIIFVLTGMIVTGAALWITQTMKEIFNKQK